MTALNLLKRNNFIIWRGGKPRNFELKAEYLISEFGNSGFNAVLKLAALKTLIRVDDWNSYHLIVRGDLMIHALNGHIMSEVIDDDRINRRSKGLIGVQVHVGPPMKVEYRRVLLKTLD